MYVIVVANAPLYPNLSHLELPRMQNNLFKYSNEKESLFLEMAYARLKEIEDEICFKNSSFWLKDKYYRYARIKEAFALFTEISSHKSMKLIKTIYDEKSTIPFLTNDVFRFVRNVISHFPLFDSWDDVWISKTLINWNKAGQSIDKFLRINTGKETLGYAYKEANEDKDKFPTMVYVNFPKIYDGESKIYLKEMITEKDGIIFSIGIMTMMILSTQKTINKALDSYFKDKLTASDQKK